MRHIIALALLAAPAAAQTPPAYQAPDYRSDASWLCRPGRADACAGDADVTEVRADGGVTLKVQPAATKPAFDCFYVYPTVSTDPAGNSDMTADPAELNVARIQFAPFRGVCRTYAPLYRQVTLKALRDRLTGQPSDADQTLGYRDVVAAWNDYLARDNRGRGVLLIGHSQGSRVIKALIQNEIEGKPIARRIVAAYIPGNNVLVPAGKDVGGDFKAMPLCRAATQTGCVVAYASWRAEKPVPAASLFGRTGEAGMQVACTNPAALTGGASPLNAMLPNRIEVVTTGAPPPKWARGRNIYTPFVAVPGLLSGECRSADGATVLAVTTNADPADPRLDDVGGDVVTGGQVSEVWGLHLIDINVAMGDLLALATAQGAAWTKGRP